MNILLWFFPLVMPFPFVYVCDLLEDLACLVARDLPLLPKDLDHKTTETTIRWFKLHRSRLDAAATDDDAVLLTLTPDRRSDRIYGLDSLGLEQVVARVLNLPKRHHQDLQRWRCEPAKGDLAACVERVMENMTAENQQVRIRARAYAVTVEQVDHSLLRIASQNRSSSTEVRSLGLKDKNCDTIQILGDIYNQLTPRDAKWLTRLILKDYSPVKFPDSLICLSNHSFLPRCIQVRAQFSTSIPNALRRDGPGSLRLAEAAKSANILQPTPPVTTSVTVSSAVYNNAPRTGPSRSSGTKATDSTSLEESPPGLKSSGRLTTQGFINGRGKCQLTKKTCPLASCLFIIAPCIATTPWLIENLLPWHGVSFITSLQALLDPTLPRRCPQTGKKFRKIILVETNRPEKTAQFLKRIGNLNLRTPQGKKQWVEVFDWRILECIAKVDQGKELAYDPWRRCWIGAV